MPENLLRRLEDLEQSRQELLRELADRNPEQLGFRPSPDSWTMKQVAQHLMLVETAFLKAAERTGPLGGPTLRQRLQRPIVRLVFALGLRVKAPSRRVVPDPEPDLAEVRAQWDEAREQLRRFLADLGPETVNVPRFLHPVAGPLTPAGFLTFLSNHFEHHRLQLRRIASSPGFP